MLECHNVIHKLRQVAFCRWGYNCRWFSKEILLDANPVAKQSTPAGVRGAATRYSAITFLNAASLGAILPQIFFVNDLGHPLQTGLLLALFPAGRLVGKYVFHQPRTEDSDRWPMLLQSIGLTLAYGLIVVSTKLHPTGIEALRLTQLAWFLIGFFGANLLFPRRCADESLVPLDISILGIPIGSLLCSALIWGIVRSYLRYDITDLFRPAMAAAGCSGLAVILLLVTRRNERIPPDPQQRQTPTFLRAILFSGGSEPREAIVVSAGATLAVAVACTLTPMMLWETFAFSPGQVALMIASGGLLAVSVQFIIRRLVGESWSTGSLAGFTAIGLFLLGASSATLMWAPGTGSWIPLFAGFVALPIGWGCLQPALSRIIASSRKECSREAALAANDLACTLAWIVGPILSAGIFYAHERTSFGISGLAIALIAIPFANLWRKHT
jgi:hypothetical protein